MKQTALIQVKVFGFEVKNYRFPLDAVDLYNQPAGSSTNSMQESMKLVLDLYGG